MRKKKSTIDFENVLNSFDPNSLNCKRYAIIGCPNQTPFPGSLTYFGR